MDLYAIPNTAVLAAAAGYVIEIGQHTGFGLTVVLEHDNTPNYETLYAHLNATIEGLQIGQHLNSGQQFAFSGDPNAKGEHGPHLHFEISRNGPLFSPARAVGMGAYATQTSSTHVADQTLLSLIFGWMEKSRSYL